MECGIDIIEIERLRRSIARRGQRLLDRLFTAYEQAYCEQHIDPATRYAGRFAAKEAVVKALGSGIGVAVGWLDVEIRNQEDGRPYVKLNPSVAQQFGDPDFSCSISHCQSYATAMAIATPNNREDLR